MAAPIIKGLITYLTNELELTVWDGEVPRYAVPGTAINQNAVTVPTTWPVVQGTIVEPGFSRAYTTENAYTDDGTISVSIWAVQRTDVDTILNLIETQLGSYSAWTDISGLLTEGLAGNPYYIIQMELVNWCVVQEEGVRIGLSDYLYRGDMKYFVQLHGALAYTA